MKALTREQALAHHEKKLHDWAVRYSRTCDTSRFIGLTPRQIERKLQYLGLGFNAREMPMVVMTISDRLAGGR